MLHNDRLRMLVSAVCLVKAWRRREIGILPITEIDLQII
jgi:hypothetical protein